MGQCSCYADGVLQNSATIRSSAGFQQAIAFPVKFWPMESVTAMVCLQHGSQHGVTRQCDGPNLWFASLLPDPNKARSNGFRIWWCGLVRRNYSFLSYSSRSFVVQSGCEICRGEDSDTEPFCSVPRLHLREKKRAMRSAEHGALYPLVFGLGLTVQRLPIARYCPGFCTLA